jgi:hypothetical protein
MTESVITAAARELGYTERPINRTKYGQAFGLDGAPWCAIGIRVGLPVRWPAPARQGGSLFGALAVLPPAQAVPLHACTG